MKPQKMVVGLFLMLVLATFSTTEPKLKELSDQFDRRDHQRLESDGSRDWFAVDGCNDFGREMNVPVTL